MPSNYYAQPETESDNSDATEPGESSDKSKQDGAETFLAPKTAFGDVKPGDTCEVKVVHVYEDEIELEYVRSDEEESETPTPSAMDQSMNSMDAMAGKGA